MISPDRQACINITRYYYYYYSSAPRARVLRVSNVVGRQGGRRRKEKCRNGLIMTDRYRGYTSFRGVRTNTFYIKIFIYIFSFFSFFSFLFCVCVPENARYYHHLFHYHCHRHNIIRECTRTYIRTGGSRCWRRPRPWRRRRRRTTPLCGAAQWTRNRPRLCFSMCKNGRAAADGKRTRLARLQDGTYIL